MRFRLTLLVGLTVISLAGCASQARIKPPTPALKIIPRSDGGVCMDRANAIKLGTYIIELEAGYE